MDVFSYRELLFFFAELMKLSKTSFTDGRLPIFDSIRLCRSTNFAS